MTDAADNQDPYEYLIAVGANLGSREETIERSISLLREHGEVIRQSELFATRPVGAADREFLNGAFIFRSAEGPLKVLERLLSIERSLGRTREVRWGNRTIDLDIISVRRFGKPVTIQEEMLEVPHPRAHERDFVLRPAAQVAEDWPLGEVSVIEAFARLESENP